MEGLAAHLTAHRVAGDADALSRSGITTLESFAAAELKAFGFSVGARARLKPAQRAAGALLGKLLPVQPTAATLSSAALPPTVPLAQDAWYTPTGGLSIRDAVVMTSYLAKRAAAPDSAAGSSSTQQTGRRLLSLCGTLHGRSYACSLAEYRARYRDERAPLPMLPPPLLFDEEDEEGAEAGSGVAPLPSSHPTPFVTRAGGEGPPEGVPRDAADFIARYLATGGSGGSSVRPKPPHVLLDEVTQPAYANVAEAAQAIGGAAAEGRRMWVAQLLPEMAHPPWWPVHAASIPTYESLLVGGGATGVGMHRDRFVRDPSRPRGASERWMCTYISLARGVKHVLLLPPTPAGAQLAEALGGAGCDEPEGRRASPAAPFPSRPPPEVLERVVTCGGYWFDLGAPSAPSEPDGGGSLCLFLPAGWWHWLVGDCAWHVAWSASFFPEADREGGGGAG